MADLPIVAIYKPPKFGLPYLAVVMSPDGRVEGLTAKTAAEAQSIAADLNAELAKAIAAQAQQPSEDCHCCNPKAHPLPR